MNQSNNLSNYLKENALNTFLNSHDIKYLCYFILQFNLSLI